MELSFHRRDAGENLKVMVENSVLECKVNADKSKVMVLSGEEELVFEVFF